MSIRQLQNSFLVATLATSLMIPQSCFAGAAPAGSSGSAVAGKTISGKATYYPDRLNGHKTASGEEFDQRDHTAASNKLPLGTTAKITNLKTGKSTDVTVNDRGPALGNRKIDLSKEAAKDIGLTRKEGITPVKIKVTAAPPRAQPTPVRCATRSFSCLKIINFECRSVAMVPRSPRPFVRVRSPIELVCRS